MGQEGLRNKILAVVVVAVVILILTGSRFYVTVPVGHVAVATFFGRVVDKPYGAGLHFPVNPLYSWYLYDVRHKTHTESVSIPSQDQLTTQVDVSVQYQIIPEMTPRILRETGTSEQLVNVHLIPRLRSLLREEGKTIKKAEEFFLEETQKKFQSEVLERLRTLLEPKGLRIEAVLLRDIRLPSFIVRAIEQKKEREQAAEKQKAELERFKTEQMQKVVQAEAERKAAEEMARKMKIMAEAKAYEIERINKAIAGSPAYIQLKALEALEKISKDPAAKIYFINGDSPRPLPLMHMGETEKSR